MFIGFDLQRVIAAPPQTDPLLRVLTLEVYGDGFIVRYVTKSWDEARRIFKEPNRIEVEDDRGTHYLPDGGGAGGTVAGSAHGWATFTPTIHRKARTLTVTTAVGHVPIPLT